MLDEQRIYNQLTEIFNEVFLRDDIRLNAETTAKDIPGWDSFKHIEIIMQVEEIYNIKFQTRELDAMTNVGEMVAAISRKSP
jgi:acyl carrier protein